MKEYTKEQAVRFISSVYPEMEEGDKEKIAERMVRLAYKFTEAGILQESMMIS